MRLNKLLKSQRTIVSLALIIIIISLLFFQFKGITFYDEGYILNAALRVAHGEIPYKDFDMVYTPLSFVITSAFITMFGESVFAGRLAALAIAILSLCAIYFILKLFTKNKWIIYGTLLFFIAWGPTHINFPWPTMFAACFFLYACLFFLRGINNHSQWYLLFAGIMTFLVVLSKQNFGGGTFIALLACAVIVKYKDKKKLIGYFLGGFLLMTMLYSIFLFLTGSFNSFIENMNLYTLRRVFVDKSLETPFLYEGSIITRFLKLLFYTSPILIAAVAFKLSIKSKKKLFILPILTTTFYLLGIRPTTDYVHVVSLIAISCIPFAIIIAFSKGKKLIITSTAFLLFIGLGLYTAYFKGYYQWEPPLKDSNSFVSNQNLKIYLTESQKKETEQLVTYIQTNTTESEPIFVNYYAPLIYFVSNRNNPTAYDLISINQLPISYQQDMIETLKNQNVKLVVTHTMHVNEASIISTYIKKNYSIKKSIGGYIIYQKNKQI